MSPGRKKPHCRVCGAPMAGHKRRSGVPICPTPPSPPASPPRPPHQTPSDLTTLPASPPPAPRPPPGRASNDLEGIVIPEYGLWRRLNPNWQDPPRPPAPATPPYAQSLVPTVVDDDTKTELESDDGDDDHSVDGRAGASTSQSDGDLIERVLGNSVPLATLFSTPKADVPLVRRTAAHVGLHFASLRASSRLEWLVMGCSATAVQHLLELEQKRMPGVFVRAPEADADVWRACAKPGVLFGFFQMVLAGAIGGIVVARGLSLL